MSEKSINRVEVSGLLRNATLRSTQKGTPVCSFSLAVVDSNQGRTFINAVAWKGQAERVGKWPVDSKVYVTGRLQTSSWDDAKSGTRKYKTEIVCESVDLTNSLLTKPLSEVTPQRPISDEDCPF